VWISVSILVVGFIIAGTSTFFVRYATKRYQDLRTWTEDLEPKWKRDSYEPLGKNWPRPNHFLMATPWFILILITAILFVRKPIATEKPADAQQQTNDKPAAGLED
jgi:hypothetical protein